MVAQYWDFRLEAEGEKPFSRGESSIIENMVRGGEGKGPPIVVGWRIPMIFSWKSNLIGSYRGLAILKMVKFHNIKCCKTAQGKTTLCVIARSLTAHSGQIRHVRRA